jgi:hypothetical protein
MWRLDATEILFLYLVFSIRNTNGVSRFLERANFFFQVVGSTFQVCGSKLVASRVAACVALIR